MSQTTESASSRFATLEDWSSTDLVTGILEGQFSAISAVQAATPALVEAIDRGAERLARGGRLIYLGAGTSGRIATQDGAELPGDAPRVVAAFVGLDDVGPKLVFRCRVARTADDPAGPHRVVDDDVAGGVR